MLPIIDNITSKFQETIKFAVFNNFKTNNIFIDTIIYTIFLTASGYLFNYISENDVSINYFDINKLIFYFRKINEIELEGKRSSTTSLFPSHYVISSAYSDRFKAFWHHIINNMENISTIYKIKEIFSNSEKLQKDQECNANKDIFMVSQDKHFEIDKDIYAVCKFFKEDDSKNDKLTSKVERITIKIYSYKYSLTYLKNYVNKITSDYLTSIKTSRYNKKYIYTLEKTFSLEDESPFDCWSECQFESCRTFSNMFFDGKKELIDKIDFFINNRQWYESKGIPWTCGIGLHGAPGTGKTSFIKALGNYTGYHIVFLSLKLIKTRQQLQKLFFEDTYNSNNEKGSIKFNNKITVIEDIDCIGDIVLKRADKFEKKHNINTYLNNENDTLKLSLSDVIKSVVEINNSPDNMNLSTKISIPKEEEPITLDDILNLWDGVRETPGRILVISSNHYDELDPALTRPGRIDITHEFKNVSHKIISEMYYYLFQNEIDKTNLKKIKEFFYSPAEIINIYLSTKNEKLFMDVILKNVKP